jgi:hypothetical protein
MYTDTKLCLKCNGDEVTDFVKQGRRVRQGCSQSCCLCSIFIDNVMDNISEGNAHA